MPPHSRLKRLSQARHAGIHHLCASKQWPQLASCSPPPRFPAPGHETVAFPEGSKGFGSKFKRVILMAKTHAMRAANKPMSRSLLGLEPSQGMGNSEEVDLETKEL